jgi:hypothetical protein
LGLRAIERQNFAHLDIIRIVVLHAAADHDVAWLEESLVMTIGLGVLCSGWNGSHESAD